jgi:hypothetical protein
VAAWALGSGVLSFKAVDAGIPAVGGCTLRAAALPKGNAIWGWLQVSKSINVQIPQTASMCGRKVEDVTAELPSAGNVMTGDTGTLDWREADEVWELSCGWSDFTRSSDETPCQVRGPHDWKFSGRLMQPQVNEGRAYQGELKPHMEACTEASSTTMR